MRGSPVRLYSGHRGAKFSPSRVAMTTASSLECAPSFSITRCVWLRAVFMLIDIADAMSGSDKPSRQMAEQLELATGDVVSDMLMVATEPCNHLRQHLGRDDSLAVVHTSDRARDVVDCRRFGNDARATSRRRIAPQRRSLPYR